MDETGHELLAFQSIDCYQYGVLKMKVTLSRALLVAFVLAFVAGVHGSEVLTAAQQQPQSGCHDCGCDASCACQGATSCDCSSDGPTIKARCGCGCSDPVHRGGTTTWEGLFARSRPLVSPHLMWSPAPNLGDSQAWRLPYEHKHPPRALST